MSSSDFEQRLGAEPRETARELDARADRDPEQVAAVEDALAFERKLEEALRLPVDEKALIGDLLAVRETRRGIPAWWGVAASVLLVAGLTSVLLFRGEGPDVADYVQGHYHHDGASVLASASTAPNPEDVQAVLASLGASASPALAGRVQYIKFCPTPDSRGAHMVLNTPDGPATVIFMPAVSLSEPMVLQLDGEEARVVGLESGAAAIIGVDATTAGQVQASLQDGLRPLSVDA